VLATWTGAAGDGNYWNPANWSNGVVPYGQPGIEYQAVVTGSPTVVLDGRSALRAIQLQRLTTSTGSLLSIAAGRALSVVDASISGVLRVSGSGDGHASSFVVSGATILGNTARIEALGGASVSMTATSYDSRGVWSRTGYHGDNNATYTWDVMRAEAGSTMNLATMQSWNAGFDDGDEDINIQRIVSTGTGSVVDLSGLRSITAPVRWQDRVELVTTLGGQILVPQLTTIGTASQGRTVIRTFNGTQTLAALTQATNLDVEVGPSATLTMNALQSWNSGTITVQQGATLSAATVPSLNGIWFDLWAGSTTLFPALTALTSSVLTVAPNRTTQFGLLSNVSNSRSDL
jgi:hypothetical protein